MADSKPSPRFAARGVLSAGALLLAAVSLLPLLGRWLAGHPLEPLFRFPPPPRIPTEYPHFSGWAAALVLGALALVAIGLGAAWRRGRQAPATPAPPAAPAHFPVWGWLAAAWTVVWWILAWNRFAWMSPLQRYTFFPLWIGFIVTVNALVHARGERSLMVRAPRRWLALFPVSAGFWWGFEWLNRFVENWHYLGVAEFSATEYAVHASLCFSTVLPAVLAVRECLGSRGPAWQRLRAGPSGDALLRPGVARAGIALGAAGSVATGAYPQVAYPALWAAPLLILFGLAVPRCPGGWQAWRAGDWRGTAAWAAAALICGFWWEMWNVHSLAKWIYTVPYVDRWHVFEMPLLGYSGYLAFGWECALVTAGVLGLGRRESG